jgi:peptidoglycan/xylan/chitin deacetylase (PgdA/CDA1 family)
MSQINIPILMYHSIASIPKDTVMRSLHVPPKRFKFQMWMLKKLGYKGLSIKELKPYLDGDKKGKVVGITFDDGYQNNLTNAAKVLIQFNFTATCYIVSDRIGESNLWDLHNNITQRPLMTEDDIQEWISLGMDIGAHSLTHTDLTKISEKQAQIEIVDCKKSLEKKFKLRVDDFCYPFGYYDDQVCKIVKEAGYSSATTMLRGNVKSKTNRFLLPRIPITHHTMPHLFLIKILTKYEDKK